MTLDELHSNEELRQHEFPVTRDKVFLAHAGVCPLPRRVADAVARYAVQSTRGDQEDTMTEPQLRKARTRAANCLGATPEEVAFVGPTSLALSYVAGGLNFRRSDNILIYFDDYPSNVYPWLALADKGVEVRLLNIRELGRIRAVDVLGQIDEATRLVALASCHFISGFRLDIASIGSVLRQRGILFCLDAIQTVGAFPTPTEHVDFLAADAHKWMLGPCAAGILYVRQEIQEQLSPITFGWNNVRCPNFVAQEELAFRSGSKRYEAGSHNLLGLVGMDAALELLDEIGMDVIARDLLRKRAWVVPALEAKGYTVLQAASPMENTSGIISFFKPGVDMDAIHAKLMRANIVTSLRGDRSGQKYIRLSPHFYNTDAELGRALESLK